MGIGTKIKEYRKQCGLTQKDLSEKLNVTYQAVSRWENDDVEPSVDTLKEMAVIFNCSLDELFGVGKEEKQEKEPEKIYVTEKPVLTICQKCNKPIYESNDIKRFKITHTHRSGKSYSHTVEEKIYCTKCNDERLAEEARIAKLRQDEYSRSLKIRRIHSFVWPSIILLAFIVTGIVLMVKGFKSYGTISFVAGVFAYTFVSCLILYNNKVIDLWEAVSDWSIHFPGILFTLDLDGILGFIGLKIAFAIIGFAVTILGYIFAILLCSVFSIFVYPFALKRNIQEVPDQLE